MPNLRICFMLLISVVWLSFPFQNGLLASGMECYTSWPINVVTETIDQDAWYVYKVTDTEVVLPRDVRVIWPVPNQEGAEPTERYITLTTCHPMFSARERYVVHGVLDYWAPTSDGVPAELAEMVESGQLDLGGAA